MKKYIGILLLIVGSLLCLKYVMDYNSDVTKFKSEMKSYGFNIVLKKSKIYYLFTPHYLDELNNGNKFQVYPYSNSDQAKKEMDEMKTSILNGELEWMQAPELNHIFFLKDSLIVLYWGTKSDNEHDKKLYEALVSTLGVPYFEVQAVSAE